MLYISKKRIDKIVYFMDIIKGSTVYKKYMNIDETVKDEHIPISLRTDDYSVISKYLYHILNNVYPNSELESSTITTYVAYNGDFDITIEPDYYFQETTVYLLVGVIRLKKSQKQNEKKNEFIKID